MRAAHRLLPPRWVTVYSDDPCRSTPGRRHIAVQSLVGTMPRFPEHLVNTCVAVQSLVGTMPRFPEHLVNTCVAVQSLVGTMPRWAASSRVGAGDRGEPPPDLIARGSVVSGRRGRPRRAPTGPHRAGQRRLGSARATARVAGTSPNPQRASSRRGGGFAARRRNVAEPTARQQPTRRRVRRASQERRRTHSACCSTGYVDPNWWSRWTGQLKSGCCSTGYVDPNWWSRWTGQLKSGCCSTGYVDPNWGAGGRRAGRNSDQHSPRSQILYGRRGATRWAEFGSALTAKPDPVRAPGGDALGGIRVGWG